MVLQDVLKESQQYFMMRKGKLTAAVLGIPKGSLKQKQIRGHIYLYLHTRSGQKVKDAYLGRADNESVRKLESQLKKRSQLLKEIAVSRQSLKTIGVPRHMVENQEFSEPIRNLFHRMDELGLWDYGLELIGSWCFKVYQNYMGVDSYPLRTFDVDLAIPVPYKGKEVNLGKHLEDLGFILGFRQNGAMFYEGFGLQIELLSPDKGKGVSDGKMNVNGLHVSSLALRYLGILLQNPVSIRMRQLGKITIPSMPAFFIHKLLVARIRREKDKKEKDYKQVNFVAKRILQEEQLEIEFREIMKGLSVSWIKKIVASSKLLKNYIEPDSPDFASVLLSKSRAEEN